MKQTTQWNESDCGVAAVAMFAGVPYRVAAHILFPDKTPSKTSSGKLITALKAFGYSPQGSRMISIKDLKLQELDSDPLLSIWLLDGQKRYGHWAVLDHKYQKVRDPYSRGHELVVRSYLQII